MKIELTDGWEIVDDYGESFQLRQDTGRTTFDKKRNVEVPAYGKSYYGSMEQMMDKFIRLQAKKEIGERTVLFSEYVDKVKELKEAHADILNKAI